MSRLLDMLSDFLAHRKGLLPLIGIVLITLNLLVQFVLPGGWMASSNLLLHVGIIIAILGLLLAWAL